MEENLKRMFTIIHRKCAESLPDNLGGDRKYEAIKRDQDVIGILKIMKGVMFKFYGNKELTHVMSEDYV